MNELQKENHAQVSLKDDFSLDTTVWGQLGAVAL